MATKRDYYEVLGVPRSADKNEIKKAFRRLARRYHPDVNGDPAAAETFKEINEAYEVLCDDQKRAAYDRFGHAGMGGGFQDFAGGFGPMADIFEEFFGSFAGRRRRSGPRRGADIRVDLVLEFEEAVFGADKEISFRRPEICPTCHGAGAEPGTQPIRCTNCHGSGEVRRSLGAFVTLTTCSICQGSGEMIPTPCSTCRGRKIVEQARTRTVNVPAGVDSETQIRIGGEGAPGLNGGPPGDVLVVISVRKHEHFRRRGDDILLDLQINVAQAALGDEVEIPTVDGAARLTIPAGTQAGNVLRMRGKGVPRLRHVGRGRYSVDGRGDQLVLLQVAVPTDLSAEQRELFQQLSSTLGKEVIPQQEKGFMSQLKDALGDVLGL